MAFGRPMPHRFRTHMPSINALIPRILLGVLVLVLCSSCLPAVASVRSEYLAADKLLREVESTSKRKYRHNWTRCADRFMAAYKQNPKDKWAPAALFKVGEVYRKLSAYSGNAADRKKAVEVFNKVIRECPQSRYKFRAAKAVKAIGPLSKAPPKTIASKKKPLPPKKTKPTPKAPVKVRSKKTGPGTIESVRFKTYPNRTRIVVDASAELAYSYNELKADPKNGKPKRLYVDFEKASLGPKAARTLAIRDKQVRGLRLAKNRSGTTRLVLDIQSSKAFKIFPLFHPYRTVIDVWGTGGKTPSSAPSPPPVPMPAIGKASPGAIAKQLALGVRKIVVDPGHGGKDSGARGYYKGVYEKDINLKIAKKLEKRIQKELGVEVLLTRKKDVYLTLEQRTTFANRNNADLFVSIHTNAAINRRAYGVETYFLNLATDEDAIAVAARENATSTKNISDLQTILNDLMQNAKINESSRLATSVQKALVRGLSKKYSRIKDKGVKQAPFYVLIGARMPAILAETGFISNKRECKRLMSDKYQDEICTAIIAGIRDYMKAMHPTASRHAIPTPAG